MHIPGIYVKQLKSVIKCEKHVKQSNTFIFQSRVSWTIPTHHIHVLTLPFTHINGYFSHLINTPTTIFLIFNVVFVAINSAFCKKKKNTACSSQGAIRTCLSPASMRNTIMLWFHTSTSNWITVVILRGKSANILEHLILCDSEIWNL